MAEHPIGKEPHDSLVRLRNERRREGKVLPYDEAAEIFGVSRDDIENMMNEILAKQGSVKLVQARVKKKADKVSRSAQVAELAKQGLSLRTIARRVGISHVAVAKQTRRLGIGQERSWLSRLIRNFDTLPDATKAHIRDAMDEWVV